MPRQCPSEYLELSWSISMLFISNDMQSILFTILLRQSYCVAQVGLICAVFLPQAPKCCDYKGGLHYWVDNFACIDKYL